MKKIVELNETINDNQNYIYLAKLFQSIFSKRSNLNSLIRLNFSPQNFGIFKYIYFKHLYYFKAWSF